MVAPGGAVQIAVADGAEVWRSHSADLEGLCRSEPLAAAELASRLGESIERERRRIERLVSLEVPQLVCRALIDLSRVHGRPCRHGGQLDLVGFTQQQLGDLVGSCRPFVSTHINKLRRRQILGHSGRVTCILDLERLKGAAGLLTPT
jgi:CRP-like cAMP-binding protein